MLADSSAFQYCEVAATLKTHETKNQMISQLLVEGGPLIAPSLHVLG